MKMVLNKCYGGYSLSRAAIEWLIARGHPAAIEALKSSRELDIQSGDGMFFLYDVPRDDPLLVCCVETLGSKVASGACAKLVVVETPDEAYEIHDYDGQESVGPPRRSDWA